MASDYCGIASLSVGMVITAGAAALACGTFSFAGGPQIMFSPPAPYTSVADSPYFAAGRVGVEYYLEDFEDGVLNVPGVSISGMTSVIGPGDSVDLDDGRLDGIGNGQCLSDTSTGVITIVFDSNVLGGYPTEVGFVWTAGASGTAVTVTVIGDGGGFASTPFFPIGDGGPPLSTSGDRFFGVSFANGIQQVQIADSGGTVSIDHIQYSAPTPGTLYVRDLINNDAKSDLVWFNPITDAVGVWYMDDLVRIGGGPASQSAGANWIAQGIGDLDGDGIADVVWRDAQTNLMHVWLMDGQTVTTSSQVQNAGIVGGGLQCIAICDVDGDGKADLVFRNLSTGALNVWFMDGINRLSGGPVAGVNSSGYTYAGTGDLNGDGRYDLVFRHSGTGFVWGLLMNGLNPIAFQTIGNTNAIPVFWELQAAGDLDGDGRADLIWRNLNTGVVNGWLMMGNYRTSGGQMGTIPLNWTLRASADLNGDGKTDLVWTNDANPQQVNGWIMDGLVRDHGGPIHTIPTIWQLLNH